MKKQLKKLLTIPSNLMKKLRAKKKKLDMVRSYGSGYTIYLLLMLLLFFLFISRTYYIIVRVETLKQPRNYLREMELILKRRISISWYANTVK